MFLWTFGNITLNNFKNKYFIPSLVFFTATQRNLVSCSQSKLISVTMSTDIVTHPLETRTENLRQGGEYIVNTDVPRAVLLQSQFCVCCCSQDCRVKWICTWKRCFSPPVLPAEVRFSARLCHLRQRWCFSGTLLTDFSESCLQSYLVQVIITALGSYPFPLFCQDISFVSSTSPWGSSWKQQRERLDAAVQSRPVRGGCSFGALQVHIVRFSSPKR